MATKAKKRVPTWASSRLSKNFGKEWRKFVYFVRSSYAKKEIAFAIFCVRKPKSVNSKSFIQQIANHRELVVVWKKIQDCEGGKKVIRLQLTPGTHFVLHKSSNKCRATRALVVTKAKNSLDLVGFSLRDKKFPYYWNQMISPTNSIKKETIETPRDVCAPGIHFFLSQKEAEAFDW